MKKLLFVFSSGLALAQSNRLDLSLQSIINGAGAGTPTNIQILSSGESTVNIQLPIASPTGNLWSDPFSNTSIWTINSGGVTYTITGDKLIGLIATQGVCSTPAPVRSAPPPITSR